MTRERKFSSPPHWHYGGSIAGIMLPVCLALLPGLICHALLFGPGVVIQTLLAVCSALILESLMLKISGKQIIANISDAGAVLTALLFGLTISPFTPWWITCTGIFFSITVAKHLYGGTGENIFNPAMAGYFFILLCFPTEMNYWPNPDQPAPTLSAYLPTIFHGMERPDAYSGATPLAHIRFQLQQMLTLTEILAAPLPAGRDWLLLNTAFLFGGIILLITGSIKWHIPVAMLAGISLCAILFNLHDPDLYNGALFHLFSGGTMLGAFFIATDPVTSPATLFGRLLFGLLVGVTVYCIRIWGNLTDGIAFAILIGNSMVPLIDKLTGQKITNE